VISFAIRAASAVEEQLKEKSRLCQLVNGATNLRYSALILFLPFFYLSPSSSNHSYLE
jgi:hypothetical protein